MAKQRPVHIVDFPISTNSEGMRDKYLNDNCTNNGEKSTPQLQLNLGSRKAPSPMSYTEIHIPDHDKRRRPQEELMG